MAESDIASSAEFSPSAFYDELSSSINQQIDSQIESFQKELLAVAKKGGNKVINNENIRECCDKLRKRMKNSYMANLNKFSIYADRNIFVRAPLPVAKISESSEVPKSALEILSMEVESLKDSYISRREELVKLSNGCKDGDLLLKDMRKALFTIRVGAQTLDECNVQPLSETVATLEQYEQTLRALSVRANDLQGQMSLHCEDESNQANQSEHSAEEQIVTSGLDDINILNSNLNPSERES